jgi:integrase
MVRREQTGKEHHEGLDFHDLRRNTGTGLVAAGVDPKTAQAVLGHSDVRLTLDLYVQAVSEQQKAAADLMGAKLLGSGVWGRRAIESDAPAEGDSIETRREAL